MLKEVFYFLKGYVIIKVCGKFPERVLNVATDRDILCWDIKSVPGGIVFKVSAKAFPFMQEICTRCGCTMTSLVKSGLMFTAKRHKKRQALLWGVALFFAIVVISLSFLWEIRIEGLETIPESEILSQLSECGIRKGRFVYTMDPEKACTDIYNQNDKLAWIGIEIRGSCALVSVAEKRPGPYVRDETVPCNIVSDKDGVVHKLYVKIGEAVVNEGDAVTEGQLLVSGILDSSVLGYRALHADAEITLRTWHEKTVTQPLFEIERVLSGNTKDRYSLSLFGLKIPLYFGDIPYEIYDSEVSLAGPFVKETISEVYENKISYSEKQAIDIAKAEFIKELEGEVLNVSCNYENTGKDSLLIHFTAEVLSPAGIKQEIARDTADGENPTG